MTTSKYTSEQQIRFWSKVAITANPDKCWEWQRGTNKNGYGKLTINSCHLQTHRVAWELAFGDIPEGVWVLHHCDNPGCVNPSHLFLGTVQDNVDDMIRKGRKAKTQGELNPRHKLTVSEVQEIRARFNNENISKAQLAREYNITRSQAWKVILGMNWKSVE